MKKLWNKSFWFLINAVENKKMILELEEHNTHDAIDEVFSSSSSPIPSSTCNSKSNNNIIVAKSEYQSAVTAIESTYDDFQKSQLGEDKIRYPSLDHNMVEKIYESAKQSLLKNIDRVVCPIDDNEYSDYVDRYHIVLDDDIGGESEDEAYEVNNKCNETKNDNRDMNDHEGEEEEIDKEELIDTKALKNARELRARIRDMSSDVENSRERVLKRAEDLISSSLSHHLIDKPAKVIFQDDITYKEGLRDTTQDDGKENVTMNMNGGISNITKMSDNDSNDITKTGAVSSLQDSLESLSRLLKDSQWTRLPNRIQSLQDTIETIQKETNEGRFMSQTEIAITSQCSRDTIIDESKRKLLEENNKENDKLNIDAMDRLALLGQLFS